jgi:hypothetical protein
MNQQIPITRFDGYLTFLGRALLLARLACQEGDVERGEAILDAAHNLPRFLIGQEYATFESDFHAHFLEPLVRLYPDLQELAATCPRPLDRS